ncbi:hypothetical protein [Dermabacter hominis]|uniref:hypothetical protein n=1 Tax=Dermabacter hominis TaxID=36740 RepID=UPI00242B1499|nr:hypothetical protein [Dermabacter hominis]
MASKDLRTSKKSSGKGQGENSPIDDKQFELIDKALALQGPIARKYVDSLRRKNPTWSDEQIIARLEGHFTKLAVATGVGIGGVAALPAVGTATAVALTAGEGFAFAEACAFLTLGIAHVRGVDMSDPTVRRTVILAILGGERGTEIVTKALGKSGLQWSTVLDGMAPPFVADAVNTQVNRWIRRTVTRRFTGLWAGRLIPFGIGAVIGGLGNKALTKTVIEAAREVFSHADEPVPSSLVDESESEGSSGEARDA